MQRRLIDLYILAVLAYASGAAISLLLLQQQIAGDAWLVVLHLVGASVFFFLWMHQGSRDVKFQSFGAVLLLSCAVFRLANAIDTAINGARLEKWHAFVYGSTPNPEWSIFWAETLTVVGFLCVSAGWQSVVLGKEINLSLFNRSSPGTFVLYTMYLCALAFEAAKRIIALDFTGLDQLILVFHLGGIAAILGIVSTTHRGALRAAALAMALGLPLAYLAANSGMKEQILLPLLPSAYFAWTACKSRLSRVLLLSCGFAILCVLQVFVQITRDLVWSGGQQLSTNQQIEKFLAKTDSEALLRGVSNTAARINLTNTHAWTMTIADNVGFLPDEIFGGLASIFVPRLIWPEKPSYQPGLQQTYRIFGYNKHTTSSTAAGFVTELYLGGGLVAAIIGSVGFGLGIGLLQRLVSRISTPLAVQVHNFALFILVLRLDEDHIVYAFSGPLFFVFFLIPVAGLWKLVGSLEKANGLSPAKVPMTGSNPI